MIEKAFKNEGGYPYVFYHNIGQNFGTFQRAQTESGSFLDEVIVLPG